MSDDVPESLVLRQLDRVERAVIALSERFDALTEKFVPRPEVMSLLAVTTAQIQGLAKDLSDVANRAQATEEARNANWKFVITSVIALGGLVVTALGITVTLLIFVLNHK